MINVHNFAVENGLFDKFEQGLKVLEKIQSEMCYSGIGQLDHYYSIYSFVS